MQYKLPMCTGLRMYMCVYYLFKLMFEYCMHMCVLDMTCIFAICTYAFYKHMHFNWEVTLKWLLSCNIYCT